MPYSGENDPTLPPAVRRRLTRRQRRVWVTVFNETIAENSDDEARAFRAAWSAARRAAKEREEMTDYTQSKAKKTEDGVEFGPEAYLYVPDPDKPSTWKLRIEEEPGRITVAQLGRAAAALGPGFRGQRVDLEPEERRVAARKLIGLYRDQDVADEDIPEYLFEIAEMRKPAAKSLDLNELVEQVRRRFEEEFCPPGGNGGKRSGGAVDNSLTVLWPEHVYEDHLIVFAADTDTYWKVPYTLTTHPILDDPQAEEAIDAIVFAPRSEWIRVTPTYVELKAFDQADGRVRWFAVSSGGFEDRDGEIVSTAFLEDAVKAADADGERGTLDIWHIPGSDIGSCDYQAVVSGFLVESGLFDETPAGRRAAERLKQAGDRYGVSIQFVYSERSPDGVYLPPGRIVRRSILPREAAAFPWSAVALRQWGESVKMLIDERKKQELEALVGAEEAARILASLDESAERLKQAGVRFKELQARAPQKPAAETTAPRAAEAFDLELSDDALGALADQVAEKLDARAKTLYADALAPVVHDLQELRAVVDSVAAAVAEVARAEAERIAEKAAGLSRAQVRLVRRPTVSNPPIEDKAGDATPGGPSYAELGARLFRS